jgi:hypothetical protein
MIVFVHSRATLPSGLAQQHEDYWVQAENRATQLLDWAVNHVCPDGNLNATMLLQARFFFGSGFVAIFSL